MPALSWNKEEWCVASEILTEEAAEATLLPWASLRYRVKSNASVSRWQRGSMWHRRERGITTTTTHNPIPTPVNHQ